MTQSAEHWAGFVAFSKLSMLLAEYYTPWNQQITLKIGRAKIERFVSQPSIFRGEKMLVLGSVLPNCHVGFSNPNLRSDQNLGRVIWMKYHPVTGGL